MLSNKSKVSQSSTPVAASSAKSFDSTGLSYSEIYDKANKYRIKPSFIYTPLEDKKQEVEIISR